MSSIIEKLKPTVGFSAFLHLLLNILLAIVLLVLIRLNFIQLAFSLVLLSKWRMVAVKPRFWIANFRANAVDIMVGLSVVAFMVHAGNIYYQSAWVVLYAAWLIFVKPSSTLFMNSVQAFIGQAIGLSALFLAWVNGPLYALTLGSGVICYFAAYHFFDDFDEPYVRLLSYIWAYFGAALTWLLAHWLIYYRLVAQPTLLLGVIGYGLAILYYLDHQKKLSIILKRQIIIAMALFTLLILFIANWWGIKIV